MAEKKAFVTTAGTSLTGNIAATKDNLKGACPPEDLATRRQPPSAAEA